MKLKIVRVYQPVEFQSRLETYFADRVGMKAIQMELLKSNIVSIKTVKDFILVPLTNVAFMVPEVAETANVDVSRERKAGSN